MKVHYYTYFLGTENSDTSPLSVAHDIHSFRCSRGLNTYLSAIPSDEEIRTDFFCSIKKKTPGPNGFTA